MRPISVLILLPPATADPHTPVGWLEAAREIVAERHRAGFAAQGVDDVRNVRDERADVPFGRRLRDLAAEVAARTPTRARGLIVVGGGSMVLARREDYEAFVSATLVRARSALTNNFYSGDAIAVPDARSLLEVPDLPTDNALPRWLDEVADIGVGDLRRRPRLAFDLDSPLDVLLLARDPAAPRALDVLARDIAAANPVAMDALRRVGATLSDRRREVLVAGRTSPASLGRLGRWSAARIRALVEERGLRASSPLAQGPGPAAGRRPPRAVLGMLLDERGPEAFGAIVAELGDAAIVDSRVLLAHRLGADELGWPPVADRLASDLLRPDDITDPWLRALTASAVAAPIPVLLGGHTLVGPGLPLLGRP
jgi:hypothetical protein